MKRNAVPTGKIETTSGHHLDVITGLQILLGTACDPAAITILKAAIDEIRDLRRQISAIRQAVATRLEQKRQQKAQTPPNPPDDNANTP